MAEKTAENVVEEPTEPKTGDRDLGSWMTLIASTLAITYTGFHLYTAGFGNLPNLIQRSLHVGFALVLVFMLFSLRGKGGKRVSVLDWIFIAISILSTAWVAYSYDRFMLRLELTIVDIVLGALTVLTIMEAARRLIGTIFTALAAVFIGYAMLGPYIPMPFAHRGFSIEVIVNHLYTTDLGLWGVTTSVSATVVAIFIIFGSILFFSGGGTTFINMSLILAGRTTGGPAKVATIASALFGTISGSAAANVAVTGSFTIPMMKRLKYSREFAAGVEATASTGGQLMPPIMGAAAFIMAEIIGIPYVDIVKAAFIPALLMYGGVLVAVHFGSVRRGYAALPAEDIPDWRTTLGPRQLVPLLGPIAVLLWFLMGGSTPQRAGFAATIAAIVLFLFQDFNWDAYRGRFRALVRALESAGYALILIAVLAATAQIVIGIIGLTGVGVRFTAILMAASNGNLFLGLLITMGVALVLGMGMPTTGAYLLAASVLAPALVRMGLEPLQAHMFVFYFAIISAITPPVCAAVFVASGIAQGDWFKTALIATRLGLVAFIIPFMFAYSDALFLQGPALTVALAIVTASVGVIALAGGVMGQFIQRNTILESVMLVAASLLLIKPGSLTDIAGAAILAVVVAMQVYRLRRGAAYSATGT
ncbi:TRAP transporter 4TM/12TM fusion protein [Mesorhizobium sp. J18]|uniref:TRAP transporter permease n=1 Tax=Mesorhizobium sp. J18 TaxID=935263 RepID=UPI00119B6234|nr:TRAP transporter fused permease subunit [Mesorhizobium sp. J18]TWG96421.1 TRAP transporter 4TM/12TM fusion protein [Mesorhizobium sp. J18]